jgi:alkylation response protein AidB-like acyl-CoA dehydrogenase
VKFDLDQDERALQAGIRDLCRSDDAPDHPRARSSPGGVSRESWKRLGGAGVFSIRLPEPEGAALGLAQAALVFEELGRANVPGPLVASHLAAGLIEGAATGETVVGLVERITPPIVLEHAAALDALLVLDDDGLWTVDAKSLTLDPVPAPLDPLTPLHTVPAVPQGDLLAPADVSARWRAEGAVLTAALCVGLAVSATDAAVAYAKEREQFGRPIGSFQAVKHLCADMLVRAEVARTAVHSAAVLLDDGADAVRAVAGAKLLAGQAAFENGKDCIQVHGGMGFTWEANVHLYVKRAAVLRTHFLSDAVHTETLARSL